MRRYAWSMLVCCTIPLLLIVLLSALGVIGAWGFAGLILLCPLLHFILMRYGYERDREKARRLGEGHLAHHK